MRCISLSYGRSWRMRANGMRTPGTRHSSPVALTTSDSAQPSAPSVRRNTAFSTTISLAAAQSKSVAVAVAMAIMSHGMRHYSKVIAENLPEIAKIVGNLTQTSYDQSLFGNTLQLRLYQQKFNVRPCSFCCRHCPSFLSLSTFPSAHGGAISPYGESPCRTLPCLLPLATLHCQASMSNYRKRPLHHTPSSRRKGIIASKYPSAGTVSANSPS